MTQQEFNQIYIYNVRTDRIGGGAFGTVYKAYDTVLDREVAIKIAEVKYAGSVELSLRREYEAIKDLPKHPYIARYEGVYTFEAPNGLFDYAVLQYYPDGNLSHLLSQKDLSFEERESIVIKLLEGIAFLHKHRVVHRDLKPANILVHRRSIQSRMEYIPKIADFGLSKIAFANESSRFENSFRGGTIRYSSPEQLKATEIRLNTDLWSWAVVAYEVLMAKPLFVTTNDSSSSEELHLMEQILDGDFRQALVCLPLKWQNILLQCLERDPEMRVRDADSLLELLGQSLLAQAKEPARSSDDTLLIGNDAGVSGTEVAPTRDERPSNFSSLLDRLRKYKYWFLGLGLLVSSFFIGYLVLPIPSEEASADTEFFSEGLAPVRLNDKYGFIDKSGKVAIPIVYDDTENFSEGLALVRLNGKCGFIDKSGKVVIPIVYDDTEDFSEGLAPVRLNGKWGFIDKSGKVVIPIEYDYVRDFSEGLASVRLNYKWGFIDKSGKVVIPIVYDDTEDFSEGLASVRLNGKWGFIDKSGKVVIPIVYDDTEDFSEGLALVRLNGKCGFIDKSGKVAIPIVYDDTEDFSEGLAPVELNGKWGFIDKSGKVVIPIEYDYVSDFSEGLAGVRLNYKSGSIDKSGKVVIPIVYDATRDFSEGLARVDLNGKSGFIDKSGKVVIPIEYDYVSDFSEGLAPVKLDGKCGFIDKSGKVIIPIEYDDLDGFH